jgi:hypothetical protein
VTGREPDIPVVLAGDMNDEPSAVTTALLGQIFVSRPLLLAGLAADSLVDDIVGIDEDLDNRRDAVVPDHAMVLARVIWP